MTPKQEVFAKNLAAGKSLKEAVVEAYGDQVRYPSQFGCRMKSLPQIQNYLMETAQECAEIQMQMTQPTDIDTLMARIDEINQKTPPLLAKDIDDLITYHRRAIVTGKQIGRASCRERV